MPDYKTTTVRFPIPLWKYLKKWCVDNDSSIGQFILDAITEKLKREPIKREEN